MKTTCHDHIHEAPEAALNSSLENLKGAGYKITEPRRSLLEAISASPGPFSADDLFKRFGRKKERLDLVTVYRSLATFVEVGILGKVELGDGILRYELRDPRGKHHHHFVCTGCRKVEPLDSCEHAEIEAQERRLGAKGYAKLSHRLEFFGLCPACASP